MNKISLFASHKTGYEITKYLLDDKDSKVCNVFLTSENDYWSNEIINLLKNNNFDSSNILIGKDVLLNNLKKIILTNTIITVYWPWILPIESFNHADITCNFHPALLPMNRGWYPHVHNLVNNSTPGVSLHELNQDADTGKIWAQKAVAVRDTDTSYELYLRLQEEIVELFKNKWPLIKNNAISPFIQDEKASTYNPKSALDKIDKIDLDSISKVSDIINKLK